MKHSNYTNSRLGKLFMPALRAPAILLSLWGATAMAQSSVSVRSDYYYPYNGNPTDAAPGYVIEILKAVFEPEAKVDYQVMPWKRAVAEAEAGSVNGVIGALKSDTPSFVFPDEPIGLSVQGVYVKKGSDFKYAGVDSLKGKKLGVINGYSYGDEVDAYIKQNLANPQVINESAGDNPDEQAVKKLQAGRIDLFVCDRTVFFARLAKMGIDGEFVEAGTTGEPEPLYISFAPKKPESKTLAEKLTVGIRQLRQSGALAKILQKYGAKDWAK